MRNKHPRGEQYSIEIDKQQSERHSLDGRRLRGLKIQLNWTTRQSLEQIVSNQCEVDGVH